MTEIKNIIDLVILIVVGALSGFGSEELANRKLRLPLLLAILIGFAGALIGVWLFGDLIKFTGPDIDDIPIIPAIVGAIILLIPWFMVRGGYTSYGKKRTWQRKYKR